MLLAEDVGFLWEPIIADLTDVAPGSVLLVVAVAVAFGVPAAGRAQTADAPTAAPPNDAAVPAAAAQAAPATTAAAAGVGPICTDRPTRSNFACTVEPGHLQYEADLVNASALRLSGVTTDTVVVINPTLKYGLAPGVDVEANLSPFEAVRTHAAGQAERTLSGPSDLYLRLKVQVVNADGGALQATLLPYLKAPTARAGLGNGAVEGGLIAPVNWKLNSLLTLTFDPEVDVLKDAAGQGRHLATAQLINLGVSLPHNLTLYGELWGDWDFDPAGTVRQYSADAALAWGVSDALQVDVGVNLGLNRYTPGVQAYVGLSQKF